MPLVSWSTSDVPERDSFEYWREAICRAVLNVTVAEPREPVFRGQISARRTGTLSYVSFRSCGHDILRSEREATISNGESYLVSLQLSGAADIRQSHREIRLGPGEIGIVEGWRPFSVSLHGSVSRVLAVVPRRMLDTRTARPRAGHLRTVPAGADFADLLREYMLRLSNPGSGIGDVTAEALGENLCNLLAVVCSAGGPGEADSRSQATARRDSLLAFVRRNFADPALSPAAAATHLGLSVRSVHKLLEASGLSFSALVLEHRLQASAHALRGSRYAARRIADIAYEAGFHDLSHFNHAFKRRFGMTPGDMRFSARDE
jgi:AraC family transcriptional regulator, positive regulator of tynA and feaB